MRRKVYLVTHGDRYLGANPSHTENGAAQISGLPIPDDVSLFVVGTGNRFQEIHALITMNGGGDIPVIYSPFCGSADGLDPPNTVVLANDTRCAVDQGYIGLDSPFFDAWGFVGSHPERALLCAGGELLIALGLKGIYQKGHLYELDPESRTGTMIA